MRGLGAQTQPLANSQTASIAGHCQNERLHLQTWLRSAAIVLQLSIVLCCSHQGSCRTCALKIKDSSLSPLRPQDLNCTYCISFSTKYMPHQTVSRVSRIINIRVFQENEVSLHLASIKHRPSLSFLMPAGLQSSAGLLLSV